MKKKRDKASLLTTAVTILLCVFFVGGFAVGLGTVMDMEGTYPPVINEEGLTPAPQTAEEALDFLKKSLEKVSVEKPKTETSSSFEIDGDSLNTDGSEQFRQGLLYIKGDAESCLADSVNKPACDFFEVSSSVVRFPYFTADRLTGFKCDYVYYQCSSCEKVSDVPLENCEECGHERPYDLKYSDNYSITLDLRVNAKPDACFAPRTQEEILSLVNGALGDMAQLDNVDVEYTGLTVYFEVNRLTDEITFLSYRKCMNVSFDATNAFINDWCSVKGGNVSFALTESFDTSFTWPALTLSEHYMSVEPKGSDNLLATLTCDNPTAYDVKWKSSDENIVTVSDEGYFDAGKQTGKAVITASFDFGGVTYSDECEVEVKIPIERLSMKHKKVSLKVGETEHLYVKIKPSDATVQTLKWYSEDERIASVDADGTVHAVAPGKVTVFCLSDDGYYKSSSEVTVG